MTSCLFKLVEIINIVYYVTFVDIGAKRNIAQYKLIFFFYLFLFFKSQHCEIKL